MSILILLAAISVVPKIPVLATSAVGSISEVKSSSDIGLYSANTGQMTAEMLKSNFKKHLKLYNVQYQNLAGGLFEPWKDFDKLKDEITWQTLVRYKPEWRYTDSDNSTWIYQAPDFGNNWPSKVVQITDKSTAIEYNVEVTAYCSANEAECAPYISAQKKMLAPRPNLMRSDIAYKQWLNRVQHESCLAQSANLSHPRYPPQALRDGIGGTVRIGFLYNACGNVRDAWIETSSRNRDLDRAALNEALKWQIDTSTLPNKGKSGAAIAPVVFSID